MMGCLVRSLWKRNTSNLILYMKNVQRPSCDSGEIANVFTEILELEELNASTTLYVRQLLCTSFVGDLLPF